MNDYLENDSGMAEPKVQLMNDKIKTDALHRDANFSVHAIDPIRCKPWIYHNRDLSWLTCSRCQDLITSIQNNSQIEPILVRKTTNDPDHDWEIIFGVRRWFACKQIPGKKVLAYETTATDRTCAILMHTENADSKDITEFERATSFTQQMHSGIFKNQTEMARCMGVTQGYVSKLISAGEIFEHSWIKELFESKSEITIKHAYELSTYIRKPILLHKIREEALLMAQERKKFGEALTCPEKFKRLIAAAKPKTHDHSDKFILINSAEKPLVTCVESKDGKFSLFIEPEAKHLTASEIESCCINAIRKYIIHQ